MTRNFIIPKPFDIKFSISIRVTKEGLFTCTLPTEVTKLFDKREILLGRNRLGKSGYFQNYNLSGLEDDIKKKIILICSEREISRKKVIRYYIKTTCSYFKTKDNKDYVPNGYSDNADTKKHWQGGTKNIHAASRGMYGINIFAEVVERVEYKYEHSGETRIEYLPISAHMEFDVSDPIMWLNSLCSQSYDYSELKEIDYNKERGVWFVNLYKAIFKMNEKITPFVNPNKIDLLISSTKLLS